MLSTSVDSGIFMCVGATPRHVVGEGAGESRTRQMISKARVKKAVRMRTFPASSREIKKSKLHTQKISLEFHEHKVY